MKKVLHITNDFSGSNVYSNLIMSLDKKNIEQIVYHPHRLNNKIEKNIIKFNCKKSIIIYSNILNNYTRLNFYRKKKIVYKDLLVKVNNLNDIDFIHAHTWYSDGSIAFELFKKFKIPYIITIRSTDIDVFLKYMPHLRKFAIDILKNAKKIIFISAIHKKRFLCNSYIEKIFDSIKDRIMVIPNGIDIYWANNVGLRKEKINLPVNLLFVGNFSRNKNLKKLINAVNILNKKVNKFKLIIVGAGNNNALIKLINRSKFVDYLGEIHRKSMLKEIINSCDIFVMPSKIETFGLVYIEALSQGIPVIFSKDQGIDGLFDTNIGEAVHASSVKSIANGIVKIAKDYKSYDFDPKEIIKNHNWDNIADEYISIYNN